MSKIIDYMNNKGLKTSISIIWSAEDVLSKADEMGIELTGEQVADVLGYVERKHDASLGVNWDTIGYWIDEVINAI